ncbi:MAG: LptE family protein [Bacteroidales bacterium]|nr:LptE family protein [Bacteroidales bacterium]
MRKTKWSGLLVVIMLSVATVFLVYSCKISYSFSGVNISPEIQTFSVQYFQNRAPIVQAQLSQLFTDALIDRIEANTNLSLTTGQGDVDFSGEIRNYETRPTAITGQEVAARNRLTVTVRVKYSNSENPELDFDSNFSRYEDYDASLNLTDVENELIELIVDNLVEDIFNKAFVNW